jgi:hypothetical protein
MISLRYLILVLIYISGHYFSIINYDDSHPKLIHNPLFIISVSTFIFFFIIKYKESKCDNGDDNKNLKGLPITYIFSQSLFYTIIAILSQYIYKFFVGVNCYDIITDVINNINDLSYIPEALFIAGFVLLINNLSLYVIYPKCV